MGIYVQSYAELPPAIGSSIRARLVESARQWANAKGLSGLFYAIPYDDGARICFYPPTGSVSFFVESQRLSFDAKTSIAGPGFHAALIDLCDRIAADLRIIWRWDAGGDETGFATHRDRAHLERSFVDQFFAFCETYKTKQMGSAHALNLATDLALATTNGIATPMGVLSREFFVEAVESANAGAARELFPWWEDAINSEFWINTLRATVLTEVEWRQPRGPWETFIHSACAHCKSAAMETGATPSQDVLEAIKELDGILALPNNSFVAPSPSLAGYKRRRRGYFLPGDWRIAMPGYYIDQLENDNTTSCIWFGDEEVRGNSFSMRLDVPTYTWDKRFGDQTETQTSTHSFKVDLEVKATSDGWGWIGFAHCVARPAEDAVELLVLSLTTKERGSIDARLRQLCRDAWYQRPQALPKTVADA